MGKYPLLTESTGFFHLGNEQKVTSCRSIHLSILRWMRVFEIEITELKKGRRKGQRVIKTLEIAQARPDPQKHLNVCAVSRGKEGVVLKIERVSCIWGDQIFSSRTVVLADYRRLVREALDEVASQSSWCLFRKSSEVLQGLPFCWLRASHGRWGGKKFCNHLCVGRCACSLETALLWRLFTHLTKVKPKLLSYNTSPPDTHVRAIFMASFIPFLFHLQTVHISFTYT